MDTLRFGKSYFQTFSTGIEREWCITNGIGGYAGSSLIGANTRKHHGLLIASLHPPVKRKLILSKIHETLQINSHYYSLSTTGRPGNKNEEGQQYLQYVTYDFLPEYHYYMDGIFLTKTIAFEHKKNTIAIGYTLRSNENGATLTFKPLFNWRDHGDKSEKADLKFEHLKDSNTIYLRPASEPNRMVRFFTSEGTITQSNLLFDEEMVLQTEIDTGNTSIDTNYTPYTITVSLKPFETKQISMICTLEDAFEPNAFQTIKAARIRGETLLANAGLSDPFANRLVASSDHFICDRASTSSKTILAGLPWFTDWGRDTMIAFTGLTLVTKRFEDARGILSTFSSYIKDGLVPNMFPDEGNPPLYNTADASLWYIHAIYEYLLHTGSASDYDFVRETLFSSMKQIISYYENGTKYSIRMDQDGLLLAGSGLDQVTWMDVRVNDMVVTPRHGKPVEINALWYNALKIMELLSNYYGESATHYKSLADQVKSSFQTTFWNDSSHCLYDVIADSGFDSSIRPNQIFAVSLPYTMLEKDKARQVVNTVLSKLYCTYGLRSLEREDTNYHGNYIGKLMERDLAYHQGTAWGYLLGPLLSAYVKVYDATPEQIDYLTALVEPIKDHLMDGCIGQIAELFDGEEPHHSRGCYAQAWSVGELLRSYVEDVLPWQKKTPFLT